MTHYKNKYNHECIDEQTEGPSHLFSGFAFIIKSEKRLRTEKLADGKLDRQMDKVSFREASFPEASTIFI